MTDNEIKSLIRRFKVEKVMGMISVIGGLILAVTFPILSIIDPKPFDTGTLRVMIIIPFTLWYGFRCIGRANDIRMKLENAVTTGSDHTTDI